MCSLCCRPSVPPPTFWYAARIANVCISNILALCAQQHWGRTPVCRKGRAWRALAISVAAGTGADVMAGGAGAAGPAPDVRHPPPGYPDLLQYNTGYPVLSRDIQTYPKTRLSRDIPSYPGITRPGVYPGTRRPGITLDNPKQKTCNWISQEKNLVLGYLGISWDISRGDNSVQDGI